MRLRSRRISARVSATRRRWMARPVVSGSAGWSVRSSCWCGCPVRWRPLFFGCVCHDGQEGVGEYGEGDMSVPGVPGADLVVVESNLILGGSETFFDGPARPRHVDEFSVAGVARVVAVVESELSVIDGSADQVLVVGVRGVCERPVVDPEPFRSDTAGAALPGIPGQPPSDLVAPGRLPCGVGELRGLRHGHHIRVDTYGIRLVSR